MQSNAGFERFLAHFPKEGALAAQIEALLEGATRAPSTHNSQPWRFTFMADGVEVLRDTTVELPNSDKETQYAHISIGFLLQHIETLGRYLGMKPRVTVQVDGAHIARVSFVPSEGFDASLEPLVRAIFLRRNRRGNFTSAALPEDLLGELRSVVPMPTGLSFSVPAVMTDATKKRRVGELTLETMVRLYGLSSFRKEMSQWVVPSTSRRRTGIPGYSLNQPLLLSLVLPSIIRRINIGKLPGKLSAAAIASAPALVAFGSKADPAAWLSIGYESSRIILTLVSRGFDASVYVATAELPDIRKETEQLFGLVEDMRFLFAIGKLEGRAEWYTPRVALDDKLQ